MRMPNHSANPAVLVSLAFLVAAQPAQAMGKKSSSTAPGTCTVDNSMTTPNPARKVVLGSVGTMPFTLPNGSHIDLTADLNTLLNTAVAGTQNYFPTDEVGASDPCGTHLEVAAAVSTLSLNTVQFGVQFGYSPSGATTPGSTNVTGNVTVNVGTIAIDFSIRQCSKGSCTTIGAVSSNAHTAGVNTSFTLNLADTTTSPSLVYNSDLGNILRGIMNDGARKLVAAANPSLLSWSATVRQATPGSGSFIFDAGTQALLKTNQTFAVYAVTPATSRCDVFQAVAYGHTTLVTPLASTAVIDQSLDSRGVQEGDLVVIRPAGSLR